MSVSMLFKSICGDNARYINQRGVKGRKEQKKLRTCLTYIQKAYFFNLTNPGQKSLVLINVEVFAFEFVIFLSSLLKLN
jgi:hypothetical protein